MAEVFCHFFDVRRLGEVDEGDARNVSHAAEAVPEIAAFPTYGCMGDPMAVAWV